ncbi:RagB/SusD family nutrient uptake outer membrane protein [Mucilaginibacter paludis]|uniref:RagB/SusD domain-containing protein n=1 Tax=Mucilaginibacter paludis DSM 18603 TaxID=714943 RepID=H1YHP6_9SPHI|nr:RagB/SusD family nutrient uptake outer membrane protein [Mucilaginibacter paludis]EHQ27446.1 RagB/SusD domain-containing protein [Mucilaginibacter paludis DSM 18603]
MKKIIYTGILILLAGILMFSSCTKKLDEYNPSGFTASTFYTKAVGFETLVNAAYTFSRFWYGKEEGYLAAEMGTDIWTSGAGDPYPMFTQYYNLQGTADPLPLLWNNLYAGVNLCNTGIAGIGNVTDYTAAQKTTREAELRFLRAFYYWHIVETWGGVNFTTTPTDGAVTTANRTPVETFYTQIFTDLKFAVANLPVSTTDYGRATIPVAKAFLARMYLTRGMNAEAFALADDVIKNYGYALQPRFVDLWNMGNLKNKEVIWAIDYSTNLANNDLSSSTYPYGHYRGSNNGHMMYLMVYDQVNSALLARDIPNGRPFNRYMPTLAYLNLFDQANDSRYSGSFQNVWYANKAGNYNGNAIKVGDTICYTPNATIPLASQSKKYITYDLPKVYDMATSIPIQRKFVISLSKFKDSTRASVAEAQSARDVFVIRLAEMYLVAAEAKFNLGDPGTAATYINVIRTRAAKPGKVAQMQITPAQVSIDFILDERARELGGEQLRWFDLKRTGKLASRIQTMNPDAAANFKSYHLVRPIPQASQLDPTTNKDVFTQNPGYN